MARGAVALRFGEVVDVDVLGVWPRDDLFPLDCLDVTKIVVVQDTNAALQDICK